MNVLCLDVLLHSAFAMLMELALFLETTAGKILIALTGLVIGLLAVGLLAIIEYGAWALVSPPRPRNGRKNGESLPQSDLDPGIQPSPISTIAGDGVKLAGRWYPLEAGRETGRTVLLIHGFAEASDALQAQRVAALNRGGWNVAAIDMRGYGESAGALASFGGREAGDIGSWLDTLAEKIGPDFPLEPILWGRSMGAAIALRTAAEDRRIKALILESPMVDLDEAMAVWFRKRRFPFPRLLARLVTRRAGRLAGVSLTRPRPIDAAAQVRCPVLIIHGSEDTLVPTQQARRLGDAFSNPPRFIEVPGAGHTDVVAIGGDGLLEEVRAFLERGLQ